ncbi:MAG: methyltransferase domain-containing protein, partial [Chloroflexi bacterium]|nr:methyltransferase domain-containing protein [Chloroflexota bacterium]
VGPQGHVISVDMTPAMIEKARAGAASIGLNNIEFRPGLAEKLPVADREVNVVISNGVINLTPDKENVLSEIYRVLRPGGHMQVADILVHKPVPQDAKDDISLWSG